MIWLTHRETQTCINTLGHDWSRQWFVTCSVPSHHRNQCCLIVNSPLRNKLQWNSKRNSNIFINEKGKGVWKCRQQSGGHFVTAIIESPKGGGEAADGLFGIRSGVEQCKSQTAMKVIPRPGWPNVGTTVPTLGQRSLLSGMGLFLEYPGFHPPVPSPWWEW